MVPVKDWPKWETPPTNKDATQYVVPPANSSSATQFAPERQNSNEYIVPTYNSKLTLAPDRGMPFDLLLDDVKAYEEFKSKDNG